MDSTAFALVLVAVAQVYSQSNRPVPITVFYETQCPDSQDFIVNGLEPALKRLSDTSVELEFVPFGKAKSNRDGSFTCQHGALECRGNMIDSCVFSRLSKNKPQLQYVSCRMKNPDKDSYVQDCAKNVGVSWSDVISCTNSNEGRNLQLEAELKTRQMTNGLRFVPTVVFNKKFDQSMQNEVERGNFQQVLCKHFQVC